MHITLQLSLSEKQGEMERLSPPRVLLPPLSQSLITHCSSSLHLAVLQIPSLLLCLSLRLHPSFISLQSFILAKAEDTPTVASCLNHMCQCVYTCAVSADGKDSWSALDSDPFLMHIFNSTKSSHLRILFSASRGSISMESSTLTQYLGFNK